MQTRGFLERVLPTEGGDYFLAAVGQNTKFRQNKASDIDTLADQCAKLAARKQNVYFATGVYDGAREANKVSLKRAFYLDIDCGKGKPYETKKAGLRALLDFCEAAKFPRPSIIVDSGNGLHPYWPLTKPVPLSAWQPVANRLKELCEQHDFHPDPTITADAARILRVPGTFNYKDADNPQPVTVLYHNPTDYAIEDIAACLMPTRSKLGAMVSDDDFDVPKQEFEDRPRFMARIIRECNVMNHIYEVGGAGQAEPFWAQTMNLLAFTEDGDQYVHVMSEGHEDYDKRSTDKKYNYALERKATGKTGPTLCKTFAQWLPSKCAECKYNGQISSPIVLGDDIENTLPHGFRQDENGLYMQVVNKKTGEELWVKLAPYQFQNMSIVMKETNGDAEPVAEFDSILGDKVSRVNLPLKHLTDSRATSYHLSRSMVIVEEDKLPGVKKLMATWAQKMQKAKQVRTKYASLGWVKKPDDVGFALATTVYWGSGKTEHMLPSDSTLAAQYVPTGEAAPWRRLAEVVIGQDRPAATAIVVAAFAAPLIKFTGVSGAMLSVVSPESGTGKSSAMKLSQAVWGCPRRAMHALDDTPRSIAYKLGFLNNLPSYWDEIRMDEEVRGFIRLMFQLGQGKERSRLTASATAQNMGTWTTLIVAASNEFLTEYIDDVVRTSNAGRARIFEVTMPALQHSAIPPQEFAALDENFGVVGCEYAQWLVQNEELVQKHITALWQKLATMLQMRSEERFWMTTVVSLIAGAHFANKLGFINVNMPHFTGYLVNQFRRLRAETDDLHEPPLTRATNAVLEYAAAKRDWLVVADHLSRKGQKYIGVAHIQPRSGQILGVIALKDRHLRILATEFKEWLRLAKKVTNPAHMVKTLLDNGIAVDTRASVTCGIPNAINTNGRTLDIDLTNPALTRVLKEAAARQRRKAKKDD